MLRGFIKSLCIRVFIYSIISIGVFFIIFNINQNIARNQVKIFANYTLNQLKLILSEKFNKTETLEAVLLSNGDRMMQDITACKTGKTFFDEFNLVAEKLRDSEAIKALQLLPNGVVKYTYPYEENKKAIGDDVLNREDRKDEAFRAIRLKEMVISGPLTLKQGGQALIGRNPVFNLDGTFWGFSAIVLSLPDILRPLGLDILGYQGYKYSLYWYDTENNKHIIGSTLDENDTSYVTVKSEVLDKIWYLSIMPMRGWYAWYYLAIWVVGLFIVSAIFAYFVTKTKYYVNQTRIALASEKKAKEAAIEAYKAADLANSAKSTFLSTMSHDIRTPMNAIVGLCTLLEMDSNNKDKVVEYTRKINASSQHLLGLINDILDMSKIESGHTSINYQQFQLARVIDEINIIIRPQAHQKNIDFSIDVKNIMHETIVGDKLRLNQILLNLLSNALKYTPSKGSVCLEVEEIPLQSQNITQLQFIVSDNGIGMEQEFISHIFEPFARAVDGRIDKIQGTGLGMAITKNLIDLMGGTISVQSEIDKGTKITFVLNFKIDEKSNDKAFFIENKIATMLVADDDISVYHSIVTALKDTDVKVFYAENKKEVLALLDSPQSFDIILVDWKMGETNGVELATKIRELNPVVPIFIFTAYDWSDVEFEAKRSGINGFLAKPFFVSNLKQAMEHAKSTIIHNTKNTTLHNINILAAEDNEINAEILSNLLKKLGATCTICPNGKEVVKTFEQSEIDEYDIILMDVQMPEMNGLEATKVIRSSLHQKAQTIPIVAMTANAFPEDIKASQDAGMNAHISKPINVELVAMTIKRFVIK